MDAPYIDPKVIEYLSKKYPDRLPRAPISDTALSVLVGQQEVVLHLAYLVGQQTKPFEYESFVEMK